MVLRTQPEWLKAEAKRLAIDVWWTATGWHMTLMETDGTMSSMLRPTVVGAKHFHREELGRPVTNAFLLDAVGSTLLDVAGGDGMLSLP